MLDLLTLTISTLPINRLSQFYTCRKVDGHSLITDELTESEIDDTSSLEERLGHLDLDNGAYRAKWGVTRPFSGHIKSCLTQRPQSAEVSLLNEYQFYSNLDCK